MQRIRTSFVVCATQYPNIGDAMVPFKYRRKTVLMQSLHPPNVCVLDDNGLVFV